MKAINQEKLAEHATAIRALGKRAVRDIVEIGRRLSEAKGLAGHGNWGAWLEREFGWTERTARNFISIAEAAAKSANFADLNVPASALYLLAAKSTPPEVVETIFRRSEAGERTNVHQMRAFIAEATNVRHSEETPVMPIPAPRVVNGGVTPAAEFIRAAQHAADSVVLTGDDLDTARRESVARDVLAALDAISWAVPRGCKVDDVVALVQDYPRLRELKEAISLVRQIDEALRKKSAQHVVH